MLTSPSLCRARREVHGPFLDRLADLQSVVETSINTASENPVFFGGSDEWAAHQGAFHATYLALALDASLLALTRSVRSGQSRIAHPCSLTRAPVYPDS